MGRGISAAIPLTFKPHDRFGINKRDFTKGFFDCFDLEDADAKIYTIKPDLLLQNYKPFLLEFYDLIEEDFEERTKIAPDAIPDVATLDEFIQAFDGRERNNRVPFMYDSHIAFSTLGGVSTLYWLFYSGGYKAFIEVYSTFLHFERILAKTMKNPLAGAIKFGLFG